jgi:hypothetical protein
LAGLLAARNRIDAEIAVLTGRPMTAGDLGEWLAAAVFEHRARGIHSGRVRWPVPLAGSSVNVKWYLKQEGMVDIASPGPDVYLLLTGPRAVAGSSRGQVRPWCVESVYVFDAHALVEAQRARGVKLGTASSVPVALWEQAEVYPRPNNRALSVTADQRRALGLLSLTALAGL